MDSQTQKIKEVEDLIEHALWEWEVHDELEKSLAAYQDAEQQLAAMQIEPGDPAYPELQRVLSYCLMRQGNILRQVDKAPEALALGEREIAAARLSGDEITLARALMSNGTNLIVAGKLDDGLAMVEESRRLFEQGDSYDHKQGVGWCWILQADLANIGLVKKEPVEIIQIATQALEILQPIDNRPGVARAYAARAKAYDKIGNNQQAAQDRAQQQAFES